MPGFTLIRGGMPPVQPWLASAPAPRHPLHGTDLRQIGWLRYPDGLGRVFQSVRYPRLTHIMLAREAGAEAFWLVDGQPVEGIEEAVEALNVPSVITLEEAEVLDLVPREWSTPAEVRSAVMAELPIAEHARRSQLLRRLADKGCIEIDEGRIRRSQSEI